MYTIFLIVFNCESDIWISWNFEVKKGSSLKGFEIIFVAKKVCIYLVVVGLYFFKMKAEKEDSLSKCTCGNYLRKQARFSFEC